MQSQKESQVLVGVLVYGILKTTSQGAFVTWAIFTFTHGHLALLESRFLYNLSIFTPVIMTTSFASSIFVAASSHAVLAAKKGDDVALGEV